MGKQINRWKTSGGKAHLTGLVLLALTFLFYGCGGGGGSGGSGLTAGGGIGGTGVSAGVITAIGSVTVNGVRYGTGGAVFTVDDNSSAGLSDLAVGMRVIVEYTTANQEAFSVFYEPELKGPVEAVNLSGKTITVLGQTVLVNSTTRLQGFATLSDLEVGIDIVEISGFFNTVGEILAAYVELEDSSLTEFEVKGLVQNHNPSLRTFVINGLSVDYSGLLTPPSIGNGDFVEVEGILVGGVLQATELEIEDPFGAGADDEEVEIEGLITALNPTAGVDFDLNSFPVRLTAGTAFENGTASNVALNVRVEVEGELDATGVLVADKVKFRFLEEGEVKLEGFVQSVDPLGRILEVFGVDIQVQETTLLKDDRDEQIPFTLEDLDVNDFVEVGGFVDASGNVVAVKVEREETPGPGEEELEGPVDSETPVTGVEILGVVADVSTADFFDENDVQIFDPIDFFDAIEPGDIVKVKGDFSDPTFTATEVEIEQIIP